MAIRKIDQWARNLEASKQEKYTLLRRLPSINDAREGVPMYVMIGGRLYQYIKFGNKLWKTELKDPNEPVSTPIEEVVVEEDPSWIWDLKMLNYRSTASSAAMFLPWCMGNDSNNGLSQAGTFGDGDEDYQYLAPFDGHLHRVIISCQGAQSGNCTVKLYHVTGTGTLTETQITAKTLNLSKAAEAPATFSFMNENGAYNNFIAKGQRLALLIDPDDQHEYMKVTAVFKWNTTT